MAESEINGYSDERKPRDVWEKNGTIYITDPDTGMIIHDRETTLEKARSMTGVRILLSNGQTTDTQHYYGEKPLTRPVRGGEEAIYLGQELEIIGGRDDGAKVTVIGLEYTS